MSYEVTLKCNQALEEIITEYKDQWIWLHNRWHTRPEESA
jgi:lauroyl/myristoyl acyltransferase